jgi:hypothetical protein
MLQIQPVRIYTQEEQFDKVVFRKNSGFIGKRLKMSIYTLSVMNSTRPKAEISSARQSLAILDIFGLRLGWHQPGVAPGGRFG